jgi:hypothetical protein
VKKRVDRAGGRRRNNAEERGDVEGGGSEILFEWWFKSRAVLGTGSWAWEVYRGFGTWTLVKGPGLTTLSISNNVDATYS